MHAAAIGAQCPRGGAIGGDVPWNGATAAGCSPHWSRPAACPPPRAGSASAPAGPSGWSGALFLVHAGLEIFAFTPAGAAQVFGSPGLRPALARVAIARQIVGALALTPVLVGAAGFFFNNADGGREFPALWIVRLLALAPGGDGASAPDARRRKQETRP
ncbi:MAG: hypothetical protein ABR970_13360 [Roseiarcus sp.]